MSPTEIGFSLPACIARSNDHTTLIVRISREAKRSSLSDELVLGLSALLAAIAADVTGIALHGEGEILRGPGLERSEASHAGASLADVRHRPAPE